MRIPNLWLRCTAVLAFLLVAITASFATHNRAGEIRVEQLGTDLRVRATVVTFTAILGPSQMADRDSLLVSWGDGSSTVVYRINGIAGPEGIPRGVSVGNNLQRNVYVAEHTYSGRGRYEISMEDPNRIINIKNIDDSVNEVFFIRTVFTFLDNNFQGPNSTPELLQPPIDNGCVGELFQHNPNAFDPDGDSLAYRLGVPLGRGGLPIGSYQYPTEFGDANGASDFRLDEVTGTLTWRFPRQSGNYNAVIQVISYRNGFAIDTTVRDMQIFIERCENDPPIVVVENEFCLIAGDTITLDPVATAPITEDGQRVLLEVTSATLGFDFQPATWTGSDEFEDQPYTARYNWETACQHVERYPYNVIFKATDNGGLVGGSAEVNLSALEVVTVKVSAPPPQDLELVAQENLIDLSWAAPYACEEVQDSFFYGFSVWRREGSNPFPYDSCVQGLAGRGYERIERRVLEQRDGRYVYADDDTERGRTYCYRVLAQFVRYTATGRPFNLVESLPSEEVCVQSSRDLPLLTRVDVLETDVANGRIDVRWTAPLADDLDTLTNPPPYTYEVLRSPGVGTSNFTPIAGTLRTYASFAALQADTMFVDTQLNTLEQGYTYAIRFASDGDANPLTPLPASSHFLSIASSDRTNTLSWLAETSWEDVRYDVLLENAAGDFDTIATTTRPRYVDGGIENGQERCYKIVAYGTYGVSTIYNPLVNKSQTACGVPIDTMPPCPPQLSVRTLCDNLESEADFEPPYTNTISWSFSESCTPSADIAGVRVYELVDSAGTQRTLLGEVASPDSILRVERDFEIAACYAVTAIDTVGNESELSASVCVTNCPFYLLPNVITPNGDNQNDVLVPRVTRFVESVNFMLFNRWGVKVYETTDPSLGWDGTTLSGKQATEGTYFYTCEVFERDPVTGGLQLIGAEPLEGFIELMR